MYRFGPLIVILLASSALPAAIPVFNSVNYCKIVAANREEPSNPIYEDCLDNEEKALKLLNRLAKDITDQTLGRCTQPGPNNPGSYLALLGCLESKPDVGTTTVIGAARGPDRAQPAQAVDIPSNAASPPHPVSPASPPLTGTAPRFDFSHDLSLGVSDPEVRQLQIFLNGHGFVVAANGPGSPGHEIEFFGANTKAALAKFQEAHAKEILGPGGLSKATGYLGAATRQFINSQQD